MSKQGLIRGAPPVLGRGLLVVALALSLLWPAFLNGSPFWFPDSPNYIRAGDAAIVAATGHKSVWSDRLDVRARPAASQTTRAPDVQASRGAHSISPKRQVLAGRSIYYGGMIAVGMRIGGAWAAIAIQALLVSGLLVLCSSIVLRSVGPIRPRFLLIGAIVLVGATPLAFHTSMLMPDIFAGVLLLTLATQILFWNQTTRMEKGLLLATSLAMVTFHTTNILLVAMISLIAVLAYLPRREALRPAMLGLTVVVGAILAEVAFSAAVRLSTGTTPLAMPFLSARVTAAGPGAEYLKRRCDGSDSEFELCKWQSQLRQGSDNFLWSRTRTGLFQLASPSEQRRISQQDKRFFLAVAAHDPVEFARASLQEGVMQLGAFGLSAFNYPVLMVNSLYERHPTDVARSIAGSRAARSEMPTRGMEALAIAITIAGFAIIILAIAFNRRPQSSILDAQRLAALLVGSVIANAFICGALSGAHDRYQARVIWLIPLAAILVLALTGRLRTHSASVVQSSAHTLSPSRKSI